MIHIDGTIGSATQKRFHTEKRKELSLKSSSFHFQALYITAYSPYSIEFTYNIDSLAVISLVIQITECLTKKLWFLQHKKSFFQMDSTTQC